MAPVEAWPRIVCERFDGERRHAYAVRAARIIEIVSIFRLGHYDACLGDRLELELLVLQSPEATYERYAA